jgi:hypothetical protein
MNLELTGILVDTKQFIDNSLIAKNIYFEVDMIVESGRQVLNYVTDKNIAGLVGLDENDNVFCYGLNKGYMGYLEKEGFKKKQIEKEKVWIEFTKVEKFVNFIAGEKFK